MQEQLVAFFTTPAGFAVKALLVGTFVVFLLGVAAAFRDGTFNLTYVDSFVRTTLMGRVVPVLVVTLTGYIAHVDVLTDGGIAAAGVVAAGMFGSVLDSINQLRMTKPDSAAANPPPSA